MTLQATPTILIIPQTAFAHVSTSLVNNAKLILVIDASTKNFAVFKNSKNGHSSTDEPTFPIHEMEVWLQNWLEKQS